MMNSRQADVLNVAAAMIAQRPMRFAYVDSDGVPSVRNAVPSAIERCGNGETVVRTFDLNRQEPRCFRLSRLTCVS